MDSEAAQAKAQVVLGSALAATPWWASAVETVNYTASTIAVVCGALIGVHGVMRIVRSYVKRRRGRRLS